MAVRCGTGRGAGTCGSSFWGASCSCCAAAAPGVVEPLLESAAGAAPSRAFPSGVTTVEGDGARSWNQAQVYELA